MRLIIRVLIFSKLISFGFAVDEIQSNKDLDPKKNQIKVSLTDSGLERLLNTVLDTTSFLANNLFSEPPVINYSTKEKDTIKCEDKSWVDFKKLPIDIVLDQIKSKIQLGKPRVKCHNLKCSLALPIKHLNVSTNFFVKKCSDSTDLFGIKKLGLRLSENVDEVSFKLDIAIKTDSNGRGYLALTNEETISNIPIGSFSLELEGEASLNELKIKLLALIGNLSTNQKIKASEKKKYNWFILKAKGFLSTRDINQEGEVTPLKQNDSKKFISDLVQARYFSNKKSKSVFSALQNFVFSDNLKWVSDRLYLTINNSLSKIIFNIVKEQISNDSIFSPEFDFSIPGLKIEKITDSVAITKRYKLIKNSFKRCSQLKVFWGTCTFYNIKSFVKMARNTDRESVLEMAKEIQEELIKHEKIILGLNENDILNEKAYSFILKHFTAYNQNIMPYLIKKIKKNIETIKLSNQTISLYNILKKEDSVEFVFSVKGHSPEIDIAFGSLTHDSIPAIDGKDYDLAMSISINSINSYLDWQVNQTNFDFCMNSNNFLTCQNKGFFDTITTLKFNNPPKVIRDGDHYLFSIEKTEADFEFFGMPTNWLGSRAVIDVDIPFNFILLENGTKISFEAAGEINANYDFLDMSLKSIVPKLLGLVHAPLISVAMGLGADIAQTSLAKGFTLIGEDSFIREIVEITPHPDHPSELLVYLKINRTLGESRNQEILNNQLEEVQ